MLSKFLTVPIVSEGLRNKHMPDMRAVGYKRALPVDDPHALLDVVLPEPTPGPHDLIVDVKAQRSATVPG